MITWIKQLFCRHESIEVINEMSSEQITIDKSIIKCKKCNKDLQVILINHYPYEQK